MKKTAIYTVFVTVLITSNMILHAADYLARAVVTEVTGEATYSSSMQSGALIKGVALPQSYTLKTGKDSTVTLVLTSGPAIKLLPGTIVTIDTLDILSKGLPKSDGPAPLKRVALNLQLGTILVNITQNTKNIDFRVQTKFGLVIVSQPSVFEVSATSSVAEAKVGLGTLIVQTKKAKSTVQAGESGIMLDGEMQTVKDISTVEILAFGTTSSEMLLLVFKTANPENTQEVIDSVEGVIGEPTTERPTIDRTFLRPKASNQPLPPEPIKEKDPSPSTL